MGEQQQYQATIQVQPVPGTRDPQAGAVEESLHRLGHQDMQVHHVGRSLQMTLSAPDQNIAHDRVQQLCKELLVNPVLEVYEISLTPV